MQKLKMILSSSGSALIASVVFAAVFSIIGIGTVGLIANGSNMLQRNVEVIRTYWANEGAIRLALRYISLLNDPGAINEPFDAMDGFPINEYTPTTDISSNQISEDIYSYNVTAEATINNTNIINHSKCTGITIPSLQKVTWFQIRLGVWWAQKIIYGDYHCNDYIRVRNNMSEEPHVTEITSTSGRIHPNEQYDRPNYPGDYTLGIRREDSYNDNPEPGWFETRFPTYERIGEIEVEEVSPDAPAFNNGYSIILDNSYDQAALKLDNQDVVISKHNSNNNQWEVIDTIAITDITNGIIKFNKPTHVCGTLDGRLTVVTETNNDIILAGDILYEKAS